MDLRNQLLADRFLCEGKLARGGMGLVYRATDVRLRTPVVVKIPVARRQGPSATKRFVREIDGLKRLRHPHIVRILYAGVHEGLPYYVSPFLEGGSLGDRIERDGAMSGRAVRAWAKPVASALDTVHRAGVVHRDVKPSNILFDAHGAPYLADFGVLHVEEESRAQLTRHGVPVGTPAFMAPEQVTGRNVSGKSDQYALAVTICMALAGESPFAGTTSEAVMREKLEGVPARLNDLPIPARVKRALAQALSVDPLARFESCTAFVRELAPTRAPSAVPRRRTKPLGIALAVLAVLAAGVLIAVRLKRDPVQRATTPEVAAVEPASTPAPAKLQEPAPTPKPAPRETIFGAAGRGDVKAVGAILSAGANPAEPDARGLTPLHHAAWHGHAEVAKLLLDAGAPVDAQAPKLVIGKRELGWSTPLHLAALFGHAPVATTLLEEGADAGTLLSVSRLDAPQIMPKQLDGLLLSFSGPNRGLVEPTFNAINRLAPLTLDRNAALRIAVRTDAHWAVGPLVERGADPDGAVALTFSEGDPEPPLWTAARAGHAATTRALIHSGASLSHVRRGSIRVSLLYDCARNHHLANRSPQRYESVLRAILPHVDPNAMSPDHWSGRWYHMPLGAAAAHEPCKGGVIALLQRGADPTFALPHLAHHGKIAQIDAMVARGAKVNECPALHWAARGSALSAATIAHLVGLGADVDARDDEGRTALMCGVINPSSVKALLALGADPHLRDSSGRNTLSIAASFGLGPLSPDSFKLLLDEGVSVVADSSGWTVKDKVKSFGSHASGDEKDRVDAVVKLLGDAVPRPEAGWEWLVRIRPDMPEAHRLATKERASRLSQIPAEQIPILDSYGNSALHIAAAWGRVDAATLLLKRGIPVDVLGVGGADYLGARRTRVTPAMHAVVRGHSEVFRALVAAGADVSHRDSLGTSVVELASAYGCDFAIGPLLALGATLNPPPSDERLPPLWLAARHGHLQVVQMLLAAEASLEGETKASETLVGCAVAAPMDQRHAILREIFAAGEPTRTKHRGVVLGPMYRASREGDVESLRILAAGGFDLTAQLGLSVQGAGVRSVLALLEAGADPLAGNAMHFAMRTGSLESVDTLVEHGIDINVRDADRGETPLMWASSWAEWTQFEFEVLLRRGADPSLLDRNGWTVVHHAADGGSPRAVRFFVGQGMSILLKSAHRQTPLDLVRMRIKALENDGNSKSKLAKARECEALIEKLVAELAAPATEK